MLALDSGECGVESEEGEGAELSVMLLSWVRLIWINTIYIYICSA